MSHDFRVSRYHAPLVARLRLAVERGKLEHGWNLFHLSTSAFSHRGFIHGGTIMGVEPRAVAGRLGL